MPTIWEQTRDGLSEALERSREAQRAFQSAYAVALCIRDGNYKANAAMRDWAEQFTTDYAHLWGVQ